MAVTPIQEVIFENVINTALPLIDGTGDYNNDVAGRISGKILAPNMVSEFPYLFVGVEDRTLYVPISTDGAYTAGATSQDLQDGMPVVVGGFVKAASDDIDREGLLVKAQMRLISDIVVAMLTDRSRGGNALDTELLATARPIDYQNNVGIVLVSFAIKYDFHPFATTPSV